MTKNQTANRRQILKYTATGLGLTVTPGFYPAFAGVIDVVNKSYSGPIKKIAAKKSPFRIGFANGFAGNSWRAMCVRAIELEAKKHKDIAELIILDGQGDITKQVNDIESLISQEVDAIMVIANSDSAVVPVLRSAQREGIVVAPFNLPIKGNDYDVYVGTDPAIKGESSGKWLRNALDGKGKIVALGGIAGNSYTAAGWKGAQRAFEGSDIEVLAFRDTDWSEDKAKVIMADLIAAHPVIDGIWSDGGQVTSGASAALLAAGRPLVPVTGDDYNGLLKLFHQQKDNEEGFDIGLISEPTWQGVVALRKVLNLLRGNEQKRDLIITPKLINKDNYQDFMRPDLPNQVFTDTNLSVDELLKIFGN